MIDDGARVVGSDRVLAVLRELAEHPLGISLDELAKTVHSSKPTVHRALASLRKAGLAYQSSRGIYELGDDFLRLAFENHEARPETARIEPLLLALAGEYGETAHYAILDRPDVVYRAKVDPPSGAIRLTSTIGGRNPAFATAVGKLLMSFEIATTAELADWLGTTSLHPRTPNTITALPLLVAELAATRQRGYGVDDQENEVGVNCVALPVFLTAGRLGAVSISGLTYRCSLTALVDRVDAIKATIEQHLGSGSAAPR